jgi:hypothetical protein
MSLTPQDYVGKKIKQIPYDENFKPMYALMLAIVDIDGKIIGYLPPKVIDAGNGTAKIVVTND